MASSTTSSDSEPVAELTSRKPVVELDSAIVRFCGDSGDGMQLAGSQLTSTSALIGNDVATFPDFPAEIRAPRGTKAGVSGFQVHFASTDIFTPGDLVDALVAMNPAALATNLGDLVPGGVLVVNTDSFDEKDLKKAGYESNPVADGSLDGYKMFTAEMTKLTRKAVEGLGLSVKEADRCKNFFAMGLVFWLYDRPLEPTQRYIDAKFGKRPAVADANHRALKAGYNYGETTEALPSQYMVPRAKLKPGTYRNVMGNTALAWGLISAAKLSGCELFYGTYPITPASDILHELSKHKNFGVRTFQAEDEIAAVSSAIGASFAGAMGVTASSGPGIALKGEALGLAVMTELPMVIINVQRGGPSTGLPTKTEQADLLQAMFGRNGECPLPIVAASSPSDCFDVAREAWRIAVKFMVPVMVLTDGYIANGSEPWRIPDTESLPDIEILHPRARDNGDPFLAYERDENLARPWAIPGTPGLMHRIGGLEKQNISGNVSYDPDNHQEMINLRQQKVDNVAEDIPLLEVDGPQSGKLLVLSWGGTYGACRTAVESVQQQSKSVAHAHLRYMNPFPRNLGKILKDFEKTLIPELNMGQLNLLIRAKYLIDTESLNKVKGKPFTVSELVAKIERLV
ncbi:MAG: 2-oxoacid:acceptor oxidoreductase subunit alpha [Planctomycetota bacterium]|nr:2-oxoacid:acceptor oxidoreductase subunit alpha [Planctomycetota bacterium]